MLLMLTLILTSITTSHQQLFHTLLSPSVAHLSVTLAHAPLLSATQSPQSTSHALRLLSLHAATITDIVDIILAVAPTIMEGTTMEAIRTIMEAIRTIMEAIHPIMERTTMEAIRTIMEAIHTIMEVATVVAAVVTTIAVAIMEVIAAQSADVTIIPNALAIKTVVTHISKEVISTRPQKIFNLLCLHL